jgi:hypothetical protein
LHFICFMYKRKQRVSDISHEASVPIAWSSSFTDLALLLCNLILMKIYNPTTKCKVALGGNMLDSCKDDHTFASYLSENLHCLQLYIELC